MIDPLSGKKYSDELIETAAKVNHISHKILMAEIKKGRVVLLGDGKILRRGYTTGTCAAAASKAAALLLKGEEAKKVEVVTPIGVKVDIEIEKSDKENCVACVRVDSGDYKGDMFSRMLICAKATYFNVFSLRAGKGIGIVKKAGFGKVGMPDIYPHILKNIEENVKEVLSNVEIEIFVPEGEEIAKRTVLPLLGIEGGIPIFGSTGFVEPYTDEGYKHVIELLVADKNDIIGVSTGKKSKRIAVEKINFPEDKMVVAGNLVFYAIEKSKAKKKVIFTMPAKICDLLRVDAREHFRTFNSVRELLKEKDKKRNELNEFFLGLSKELSEKTGADVFVFDDDGDVLGFCINRAMKR